MSLAGSLPTLPALVGVLCGQLNTPVKHVSAPHKVSLSDRVYNIPLPLYNSKMELLEMELI